jgi:hypothetical protein
VQVLPRGPIWNVNRTSEPGLGANECVPLGRVVQVHGIPPFICRQPTLRARSSKRTVRLISGIALDECLDPERYRTRAPSFALSRRQSDRSDGCSPKRPREGGRVRPLRAMDGRPFSGERSSSAERSCDMREAKRAALFAPTISRGHSSVSRADASHASGRRRKSSCPHHLSR